LKPTQIMKRSTFILISLLLGNYLFAQKTINAYYSEGVAAYEAKDFEQYMESMEIIDEMRPNYPIVVYRLAGAYALNGKRAKSIQKLNQLLLMDATYEFATNSDFESIKSTRPFEELLEKQKILTRVEEHDEIFRTLDVGALHPESFVILDNGDILLGSIREKKIVRIDPEGNRIDLVQTPYAVLGMHIDDRTNTLWASTAALPEMEDFDPKDDGKSIILQINPVSGEVLQGIEYDQGTTIGDLTLDSESRIWLSNSKKPYLSRDETDTASYEGSFVRKQFDLSNTFFNIQGLTLNQDQSSLYFADYIRGIAKVSIATDDITNIEAPEDVLLKGIDGLYFYKNTLIAIHNGVKPFRVMQYFLDETGDRILFGRIINQGGASLGEPTLGQVKDGYFYYLANSPWGAYTEDMQLDLTLVKPIEIRRIKLD
jgi:sugar lactone lactonase YvrE